MCVCVLVGVCACVFACVYLCTCSIICLFIHYLHTIPFISYSVVFIVVFNLVVACSFELNTIRPEQHSIERYYDSVMLSLNG